jgi:hypothetical protein
MKRLFYQPLALFLVLAGYFLTSYRPNHDFHQLPSEMIEKPAHTLAPAAGRTIRSSSTSSRPIRAVPDTYVIDSPGVSENFRRPSDVDTSDKQLLPLPERPDQS